MEECCSPRNNRKELEFPCKGVALHLMTMGSNLSSWRRVALLLGTRGSCSVPNDYGNKLVCMKCCSPSRDNREQLEFPHTFAAQSLVNGPMSANIVCHCLWSLAFLYVCYLSWHLVSYVNGNPLGVPLHGMHTWPTQRMH